jgi:hypothetical protein
MAIMDRLVTFGTNFDCDAEASTLLFTNTYNRGAAGLDIGTGQILYLNMVVTEAFTDGGDSATATFRLVSDDSTSIHATTCSVHLVTESFLKADLALGAKMSYPIPGNNLSEYEQYIGLQCVIATAGFDAGWVTAWLGMEPVGGWAAYPEGTN